MVRCALGARAERRRASERELRPRGSSPEGAPARKELAALAGWAHRKDEEFAGDERFGQLQGVDLLSVQPSIRADTEGQNLRDDLPETFKNREPMIAAVPNYEDPFIKVPKVLNKE